MSRILKFRAWNTETHMMIDLHAITPLALKLNLNQSGVFIPDDPTLVVMQSTGVHDRHGTEIYEGDVVKGIQGCIVKVQWYGCGFVGVGLYEAIPEGITNYALLSGGEILGHVYEQPDLL